MSVPNGEPKDGKLEGIGESEIAFAGAKHPRTDGTFVRFPGKPAANPGGDALLLFGNSGELSTAEIEISGGRARGKTSIGALDVAVEKLETIVLPRRKAAEPKAG
jgi:hypothetical protein